MTLLDPNRLAERQAQLEHDRALVGVVRERILCLYREGEAAQATANWGGLARLGFDARMVLLTENSLRCLQALDTIDDLLAKAYSATFTQSDYY